MASVLQAFAPPLSEVARGRSKDKALYLGSAKANIGHGGASSGSSALIKVLLMMQHNAIPPHCGIKTKINHKFPTDLKERNVNIATDLTRWERSSDPAKPRRVLINNFSAAGGNSAMLIEDAPILPPSTDIDPQSVRLVAISARSPASLQSNLRSMHGFLKQNEQHVQLGQLFNTTTARRMHHRHRVMPAGANTEELCRQIETALREDAGVTRPKSGPDIIFTFTGQGAQHSGMGKQLFDNFSVFRKEMLQLERIAQALGFPQMLPVIEADEGRDIGEFLPAAIQLASICMQIALCRLWASWGIVPGAVVGHSLGEYAALNAAGVLSDADTLHLVGKRAELLQEQCTCDTHAVLVVRASVAQIESVLGGDVTKHKVEFACINSPVETVLAGNKDDITESAAILTGASLKSSLLKVPYAFHSAQLDPMLSELEQVAKNVRFSKPTVPVLCPLDGSLVKDVGVFGPQYMVHHSREPVNMLQALSAARNNNVVTDLTAMVEIGPHPAMGAMIRAVLGSQVPTLASCQRGRSTWHVLTASLKHMYAAGADIRWLEYHRDFKSSHKVISLPSYNWDMKDYWIPYVHDWSLRKGDPPLIINSGGGPRLDTTTIHRVCPRDTIFR